MTNDNHYDVIIIGTGAGGGTLAYKRSTLETNGNAREVSKVIVERNGVRENSRVPLLRVTPSNGLDRPRRKITSTKRRISL